MFKNQKVKYLIPIISMLIIWQTSAGHPDQAQDAQANRDAGNAAYDQGNYLEAAEEFAKAGYLGDESSSDFYNAGCCYSLGGNIDDGLEMISNALKAGYRNRANMLYDKDLNNLRGDSRFAALLAQTEDHKIILTDNIKQTAAEAEFVFEDAHNFIHAMELVNAGADTIQTLEQEYFAKATAGLKQMVIKYPFNAKGLTKAIAKYPERYERIGGNVEMLEARVPEFREAYRLFKEFAPGIVFPPTFFLVDKNRGIGSGSPDGSLISIERRTDESIGKLENLLVHELTHFQQLRAAGSDEFYAVFNAKKTLLALTIREGTAQFIAATITNIPSKVEARNYILAHEEDVWRRFQEQMLSSNTRNWMWSNPEDPEQPRDIAYELGALIVAAYYRNAANKEQALQEMFSVIDFPRFLAKSGYGTEFSR